MLWNLWSSFSNLAPVYISQNDFKIYKILLLSEANKILYFCTKQDVQCEKKLAWILYIVNWLKSRRYMSE